MSQSTSQKQRTKQPNQKSRAPVDNPQQFPTVSGRWLLISLGFSAVGAALCVWGALCIMFWQGSWQLLYHPKSQVDLTPSSAGVPFGAVAFATSEAGVPQLKGWWIPASGAVRYTAIYLHGADGNIGDSVDTLAQLHSAGLDVLAFDYRGYGGSQFVHPSEAHLREDTESALHYLIDTRHVAPGAILLIGQRLGANLALETASANPELAGVVLFEPMQDPTRVIFNDPRAHMVPAHWLVDDRWQIESAVSSLHVPALWFLRQPDAATAQSEIRPEMLKKETSPQMVVWLTKSSSETEDIATALSRWLDGLAVAK